MRRSLLQLLRGVSWGPWVCGNPALRMSWLSGCHDLTGSLCLLALEHNSFSPLDLPVLSFLFLRFLGGVLVEEVVVVELLGLLRLRRLLAVTPVGTFKSVSSLDRRSFFV